MKLPIAAFLALILGACQPHQVNTWCQTHTLDDVRFSPESVRGMTAADRRKYLAILNEGARLCGWNPSH